MSRYRCWRESQEEPQDFPIEAPCAEMAAADFVQGDADIDTNEIVKHPVLILVRQGGSMRTEPQRVRVTAEIVVSIWGYPDGSSPK